MAVFKVKVKNGDTGHLHHDQEGSIHADISSFTGKNMPPWYVKCHQTYKKSFDTVKMRITGPPEGLTGLSDNCFGGPITSYPSPGIKLMILSPSEILLRPWQELL